MPYKVNAIPYEVAEAHVNNSIISIKRKLKEVLGFDANENIEILDIFNNYTHEKFDDFIKYMIENGKEYLIYVNPKVKQLQNKYKSVSVSFTAFFGGKAKNGIFYSNVEDIAEFHPIKSDRTYTNVNLSIMNTDSHPFLINLAILFEFSVRCHMHISDKFTFKRFKSSYDRFYGEESVDDKGASRAGMLKENPKLSYQILFGSKDGVALCKFNRTDDDKFIKSTEIKDVDGSPITQDNIHKVFSEDEESFQGVMVITIGQLLITKGNANGFDNINQITFKTSDSEDISKMMESKFKIPDSVPPGDDKGKEEETDQDPPEDD